MSDDELKELHQLSWLELQRKKCAAKNKYFDADEARAAAKRVPKKEFGKMRFYKCCYCVFWHICRAHPNDSVPYVHEEKAA